MKSDSWMTPRTIVGRWLLASLLGLEDQRVQLLVMLNGGEPKWKRFDEPAVVEVACWLATRRLLPANADAIQISALAKDLRSRDRGNSVPEQDVTEEIIRAALGHQDVSLGEIPSMTLFKAQSVVVGYAYFKLGMDKETIERLLAEAERIAFGQGWNPPLAT